MNYKSDRERLEKALDERINGKWYVYWLEYANGVYTPHMVGNGFDTLDEASLVAKQRGGETMVSNRKHEKPTRLFDLAICESPR